MDAFLATFVMIFLAELGDKTQLIVMAFAAKYRWRQVLAGMTLGIFAVLAGAVLAMVLADGLGLVAGSCLKRFLAPHRMRLLSGVIFLAFGAAGLVQLFFAL